MDDHVGQQIGAYRLNSLIGGGEFGDVYFAEHIYLSTFAAIKLLRLSLEKDEAEKFRTKGRTIAHLAHPHIIHVSEFGFSDAIPYVVMDYAPRGTLRQHHPPGTLVPLDVVTLHIG